MKKAKKSELWYNPCCKEVDGILLEARQAARRGLLYPDARAGLRFMGVYPTKL